MADQVKRDLKTPLYAEQLFRILEYTHDFACKSLELASDKMKSYYDSRSSQRHLKVGDAVWLYNPQRKKGLSPKLSQPWQDPYVVTKCINDLIFRIQLGPRMKPKIIHHNRLWKYCGENPPTWFSLSDKYLRPCKATQTSNRPNDNNNDSREQAPDSS